MNFRRRIPFLIGLLLLISLACQTLTNDLPVSSLATPTPVTSPTPAYTPTALPAIPVEPGAKNPNEPVYITGEIPYTSPFFLNSTAEPFVLLEDEAGFVKRDRNFQFSLAEQINGPVEIQSDKKLTYGLSLAEDSPGTMLDLSDDGKQDQGVQVFAIAYWSNTWEGPFLEPRDGVGWSTAYSSAITDPDNNDEIKAGILLVWARTISRSSLQVLGPT